MIFRLAIAACILLGASGWVSPARADEEEETFRRWGIGWDKGIALRYRPNPEWGFGFRFFPDSYDFDNSSPDENYLERTTEREDWSVSLGFLVYHETRLGRWVRLGPYSELGFTYDENEYASDYIREERESHRREETWRRVWRVALGFRPAFAIEDRFVLESRFGISVTRTNEDREERSREVNGEPSERFSHNETDTLDFRAFGTNLGFGSVLQFIIYF